MKLEIIKKLEIRTVIGSNELIMLNKGGKHQVQLDDNIDLSEFDEHTITIQLDCNEKGRHEFIICEAAAHLNKKREEQEIKPTI